MRSQNYSLPIYGGGQMVINMKTTVTTSGGQHNGLVVHSAVQSNGSAPISPSASTSNWQPYIESPRMNRLEDRIEMLRSNSSLHRDHSPLPIQMVPSTSRETLLSNTSKPRSVAFQEKPPSPPPSPIYSFKGRDSPPDEFIQPTKLMLNLFRPTQREPQWQVPISRSQITDDNGGITLSKKNALLNDNVTTTTTVEVFRAPMDPHAPVIGLSQSPYGGQPLLIRTHGPQYEQWSNSKTQTMLSDEPISSYGPKGVQWKERLIEGSRYIDNMNDDKNSDYDEIMPLPYPDGKQPREYINHDYRPNAVRQPFQPITHPILSGSRDDLRSNHSLRSPSPMYVVPHRRQHREEIERRASRRSKSNSRDEPQDQSSYPRPRGLLRHRSMSPATSSHRQFGGSQDEYFMEKEFNEMEMMSSPLAESEDSLISDMSTRNDYAKASYLEYKASRDGDDEMEYFFPPPPPIPKDYSRLRNQIYRKKNEEYYLPRSKSYDHRHDKNHHRSAKSVINVRKKEAIYATPIKKNKLDQIEEFVELPKYLRCEEASTSTTTPPTIEIGSNEKEFTTKVEKVEEKLRALKLAREDSLSNLLKKQLKIKEVDKKEEEEKEKEIIEQENNIEESSLPSYVEPKDPIIKELQEFLKIEPAEEKTPTIDHRLVVKDWQNLMKSPSQSTTSSTTSTTV
ncbi:unnamed protein product [Caenorhabditis angaria]|uniref:Uncharacterized protein n=1 Tax=Caenorhabditis angaria TaxID=860376 RepID=A0A9P1I399_9PELO|nr:unnamed protein product [Caenorhabditis angaria]